VFTKAGRMDGLSCAKSASASARLTARCLQHLPFSTESSESSLRGWLRFACLFFGVFFFEFRTADDGIGFRSFLGFSCCGFDNPEASAAT